MSKRYIAAYGTLRKGHYNHNRFDVTYIGTTTVEGFQLWDLGPYPCVVRTDSNEDVLTVDILEVDEENYKYITGMEIGARYNVEMIEVEYNGQIYECTIYTFKVAPAYARQIESGNYSI